MEPANIRTCTYCQKESPWLWNGVKLKDGSKVYVDQQGQRWAGRRCPACERSRVQAAVRCDSFERDIILRRLTDAGYKIESKTLPIRVQKDGRSYTVGIKRAFVDGTKIVLETPVEPGHDLVALVFESVRICSAEQLDRITPSVEVYSGATAQG
jgi:hypothetical protein